MGTGIQLRRPVLADLPAIMAGVGETEVFSGLLQMPYPSESVWRQRIEEQHKAGGTDLLLVAVRDSQVLGLGGLHGDASPRRAHARSLGLWVLPSAQRQGVGLALMKGLIDYAENWLGIRRLELTVNVDNVAAIALYQRCQFELEGTLKGYVRRNGALVDCHTMARWSTKP